VLLLPLFLLLHLAAERIATTPAVLLLPLLLLPPPPLPPPLLPLLLLLLLVLLLGRGRRGSGHPHHARVQSALLLHLQAPRERLVALALARHGCQLVIVVGGGSRGGSDRGLATATTAATAAISTTTTTTTTAASLSLLHLVHDRVGVLVALGVGHLGANERSSVAAAAAAAGRAVVSAAAAPAVVGAAAIVELVKGVLLFLEGARQLGVLELFWFFGFRGWGFWFSLEKEERGGGCARARRLAARARGDVAAAAPAVSGPRLRARATPFLPPPLARRASSRALRGNKESGGARQLTAWRREGDCDIALRLTTSPDFETTKRETRGTLTGLESARPMSEVWRVGQE
jgi:hypothetical protein